MFSAHFSTDQEAILERLGDKVIEAWGSAVGMAQADLEKYRSEVPELAMSNTTRGLANNVHDWLCNQLRRQVDGMDGVKIVESESGPLFELVIRDEIRIRVKRQSATGAVATSGTQLALDFYQQPERLSLFEALPETNLIFGYRWDSANREIVSAAVSYPLRATRSLWVHEIPIPDIQKDVPLRTEPPALKVVEKEDPESMTG